MNGKGGPKAALAPLRPDHRTTAQGSRPWWHNTVTTYAALDLEALALILEATRKRAEAVAARRIAADLRALR